MLIYSMKPGHDGTVAAIDTDTQDLLFSYEAEKDSFPRYEVFNPLLMIYAAQELNSLPDVFAISGWSKAGLADNAGIGAGYFSVEETNIQATESNIFGQKTRLFSSSHAVGQWGQSYFVMYKNSSSLKNSFPNSPLQHTLFTL